MSLAYISQQITIYGGFFLVISGIIGNGMNVLVFSSVRIYRRIPCTFYFLIASIFNIGYITINLISRMVSAGFGIDPTRTSIGWYKIRVFCLFTLGLIILTCSSLAAIDQFFLASRSANLRRLSNIKWAHRIVFIVITLWCLHEILPLLFDNISPISRSCVTANPAYAIYISVCLLGFICVIPASIIMIFGYLTYRNIHSTTVLIGRRADRQLTKMTLIQVILVVFCIVPYSINITYGSQQLSLS